MKKILALVLALVMTVLPLLACGKDDEGEVMGADNPYKATDIVMETENFSYTRAEFSIAFYQYYTEFTVNTENIDFYNIDTEASLKDQVYYDDVTWFDYFSDLALAYMSEVLILCEAAKAEGMEITEEDLDIIEEAVDSFVRYANDYGYTEEEYFALVFGVDASQKSLREYYKKETLAIKYENLVLDSYSFTEDELATYAKENGKKFNTIDYISYTFDEDDDKNAKSAAEGLAKITDAEQFDAYIIDYMTNTLMLEVENRTTKDCYHNCKYYDEYSEFSKWAFDNAAANTTYVKANEVDGQYTVYLLTKAAGLREEVTKDLLLLTVDVNKHETTAKALSYAEELLEEWENGERTKESFEKLIDEKGIASSDGLLSGVSKGDTLPEGLEEWLYDSATEKNSAKVFADTGYYYIVYYLEDGEVKWKKEAESSLISDKYTKELEGLKEKYPIEKMDEIIESLNV